MLTVGVDIGGTSVHGGVVDDVGAVIDQVRVGTPRSTGELIDAVVEIVSQLGRRHAIDAVGLAVAGFVATDRRTVRYAPHLAWRDAPVAERVAERVGLPVTLEQDANAAAVAEHRIGAGRGAHVLALLSLGTGIGAGLLVDGQIFRGARGVAPELGHVRVVPDGRACSCGKRGCLERYCSGTGLAATAVELVARHPGQAGALARVAQEDPDAVTGRRVASAARDGDPLARQAMADLGRWLGEGLAIVADVYDPDLVVLGGGVCASAPHFLDLARDHYAAVLTGAGHRSLARLRTAQLGDLAGMIGAGVLARESVLPPPQRVRGWFDASR